MAQGQAAGARKSIGDYDFTQHGLQAVQLRYPDLTGTGLTISVKEQAFDTTDVDFRGRVVPETGGRQPFTDHATTMATLLGGAGNTAATSRGVAWGAQLASASFARLGPDTLPELRRLRVSVQNHSYGVGIERFYGPEARAYDAQISLETSLVHVFSSGNSGLETVSGGSLPAPFATLTGEFKQAKNALVVGGISSRNVPEVRSSCGPTADGRIKPELVAYGNNGTSESAALVSGVAALLQQSYRDKHGTLPTAAWVKACLVASAQDVGTPGPDYETGFGSLNALGAVTLARRGQYQTGLVSSSTLPQSFTMTVPPNVARLGVALAWTDPPASVSATKQLRQDLDLWLENLATGEQIRPWTLATVLQPDSVRLPARRGIDQTNNIEQVTASNPAPGTYRVWVNGASLPDGPQPYAVAYALDSAMTWLSTTAGALVQAGAAQPVRWQWLGRTDAVGTLAMQFAGDTTWQSVADNVLLASQLTWWTTPNQNRPARLRLTVTTPGSAATYLTDVFTLSRPTTLRVLLNCPDTNPARVAVAWNPQPGVTAYQVYRLGARYLEPLRQTADTVLFLAPADGPYVAVAPLVGGRPALPSFLIDYRRQGVGCYVTTWLARLPVADTARFDLTLGTTWNLTAITLERATPTGFVQLQTRRPVPSQLAYTFADRPPAPGPARYRLRLTTTANETILTDEQTVFIVGPDEQLVFPNPVAVGEPVSVVVADDEAVGTWTTADGRRGQSVILVGAIKQMPTGTLPPGLHVLQLTTPSGKWFVAKVVVR